MFKLDSMVGYDIHEFRGSNFEFSRQNPHFGTGTKKNGGGGGGGGGPVPIGQRQSGTGTDQSGTGTDASNSSNFCTLALLSPIFVHR